MLLNPIAFWAGSLSGPVIDSLSIVDSGGGIGTATLTWGAAETNGRSVNVRGYIDTPADADPDAATIWAGTGANATFAFSSTIGAVDVPVSITGSVNATQDVFVVAEYADRVGEYSNIVSELGVVFNTVGGTWDIFDNGAGALTINSVESVQDITVADDGNGGLNIGFA